MIDRLSFLASVLRNPRAVGAVAPSSKMLARKIVEQVPAGARVLELGPGTGVITRALVRRGVSPERITAVEADAKLAAALQAGMPDVTIVHGSAFNLLLLEQLGPFEATVSSIPLLNFSNHRVRQLVGGALGQMPPGAPFVQFSYGSTSPVPAMPGVAATMIGLVARNIPPARVWVYRRYQ